MGNWQAWFTVAVLLLVLLQLALTRMPADLALRSGTTVVIAHGTETDVVRRLVNGERVGTRFAPVNSAMETMTASLETEAPSLSKIEDKIEGRLADAKAHTELRGVTPEGAEQELREAVSLAEADAKLEELRKELGIT